MSGPVRPNSGTVATLAPVAIASVSRQPEVPPAMASRVITRKVVSAGDIRHPGAKG